MASLPPPAWIATPEALQKLAGELISYPHLAVDTESNSLYAYREHLCLVQFSTPKKDYLVDPLSLDDLSPLAPIFSNPKIEKVFHAAEYDLICLKRDYGILVNNLFDTMQAARILGYKRVGLDSMLLEKLGIHLDKKYQKADWAERPLSKEMLNYARLDTHHLLNLRDCLQIELQERDRWDLACEEFNRLSHGNGNGKADIMPWQRVKGTQKLSERQLTILQELCAWRESKAQQLNRPIFRVIDDQRLVSVAQASPVTPDDLDLLDLTAKQILVFGSDLLQAVARGRKADLIHRPYIPRPKQACVDRYNILGEWRKSASQKIGVESDVVLPKGWMHDIADKNPGNMDELAVLMPQSPWRLENFGADILDVIHGKKTINIKETDHANPL
jgi:ribonuclease D